MKINLTKQEITFIYDYLMTMNNVESITPKYQKNIITQLLKKLENILKKE